MRPPKLIEEAPPYARPTLVFAFFVMALMPINVLVPVVFGRFDLLSWSSFIETWMPVLLVPPVLLLHGLMWEHVPIHWASVKPWFFGQVTAFAYVGQIVLIFGRYELWYYLFVDGLPYIVLTRLPLRC
jgi:hypothetical protein